MNAHEEKPAPPVGYCVRCQTKRELADPKQIERGGGPAIEGKCTVCGARIFIMGGQLRK